MNHEPTFTIRKLEVGERQDPTTDVHYWYPTKELCRVVTSDKITTFHTPHFRITPTSQPMPEAKEQPKLQLEAGKFYRNRKGEKIGPMVRKSYPQMQSYKYPWTAIEKCGSVEHFKNNGRWHWEDSEQSQYDLIAPWTDDTQAPEPIERVMEPDEVVQKGDTYITINGNQCPATVFGDKVGDMVNGIGRIKEYRTTRPKPVSEPAPSQEYLTKMADAEDQCRSVTVGDFDETKREAIIEAAMRYADRCYRAGYYTGKHGEKGQSEEKASSDAFIKLIEALNQ